MPIKPILRRLRDILGADLRSLALLRMGLGLLILADLIDRGRDLRAHYTDFGLLPRGPLVSRFMNDLVVCVHLATGTAVGTAVLFGLQALIACTLLVGYRTQLMAVLSWFLMYSLHVRNPMVLQGGDDLLRMLLFWGMFVPLGARYSVDAALARNDPTLPYAPGPPAMFSVGTLALVVQVLVLYWCTALLKSGVEWHGEASAVYYALNYDQLATSFGVWLRQFTWLLPWLTRITIVLETAGPFLLISPVYFGPLRTAGAVLFMGMHHSFAACLLLGLFPWIDTVSMLMLLPTWFWERAEKLIPKNQDRLTVFFDAECEVCRKLVLIVCEFLLVQRVRCVAVDKGHARHAYLIKQKSWFCDDAEGVTHHGFQTFVALCRVSPWARFIASFLGTGWRAKTGDKIYRAVASNRPTVARALWGLQRGRPVVIRQGVVSSVVCLGLLTMVVSWNMSSFSRSLIHFPPELRPISYMLRIDQDWGMFAPYPSKEDGWYVSPGLLVDGTPVDAYTHTEGAVHWEKPALVSALYPNQRWSKYMMNIWLARNADYRLYLGQYLCRVWNSAMPQGPKSLASFEITYVREDTKADGAVGEPTHVVLWAHHCYDTPKVATPIIPHPPVPLPDPQVPAIHAPGAAKSTDQAPPSGAPVPVPKPAPSVNPNAGARSPWHRPSPL